MKSRTRLAAGFCLVFTLALATAAGAQSVRFGPRRVHSAVPEFRLDRAELDRIVEILEKGEGDIVKARAEIQVIQARIARLLLEKDPPLDEIGRLVRESLDWEYKIRMAQIERQAGIRAIVGDDRWSVLFRLGRDLRIMGGPGTLDDILGRYGLDRREIDKWMTLFLLLRRLN